MSGKRKASVAERLDAGAITESEAYELTREAALNSIDRAMQCRRGLETKLIGRGYPSVTVGAVLDRLVSVGLVDDAEYAGALVRARLDRGLAQRAIGAELTRKGVEPGVAAVALGQIDSAQQLAAAEMVAVRAVKRCSGLADQVKARRAFGAVSRRGFSAGIASAAVSKALMAAEASLAESN